ncbi:amidohydrolase family protein [Rhodocytophaga aerolata]|uniref:Amidohydrolase family protein n=1 Tax=Rhodocytophaga aerolata TaxID=455078 RepID=A0ABT8R283_9BACT|nr:amidohydrolase family protein [Rhodocytophaga aerolata]MDO1446210.1 amidohydrolase family protein [Rhodocytophaga aerolata]
MRALFTFIYCIFISIHLIAQPPTPGKPQVKAVALVGGTAHLGNGQVIENAIIAFENGKLTIVASAATANFDRSGYDIIDVSGKHIYPGLIAPNTRLGLDEVSAVRATRDFSEVGGINPNVRSLIAYNTDSELIPTTRANGVLIAQVVPQGGLVTGTSALVKLDAWNWEDAAVKEDGIHLNWPAMFVAGGIWYDPEPIKKNEGHPKILDELSRTFADALAYSQVKNPSPANLKLESMRGLFDGSKNLYIHANYGKEIIEGVQFAKIHGVKKVVIMGGEDAWMVVDFLKENNVAVIVSELHRLPTRPEDDVDLPFKLPAMLSKAGILVGLSYPGETKNYTNLAFMAGTAAGYGLSKEEALTLVTANNAKILGIDNQAGTLEKGKDATLVVSSGDLLDMRTNDVTYAFIQGRQIVLDNKHKRLFKRFDEKYSTK